MIQKERDLLLQWYQKRHRQFPWRQTKNPYAIWISEIMLQQTRASAVIEYFNRFLKSFPDIAHLANAPIEEVLEAWAGLGYYSRARNIHKAAQLLAKTGFPENHQDLLNYPGIGDYTARAISSFAFSEKVGVLDGNVIRFLSRYHLLPLEPWKIVNKKIFQSFSDGWAEEDPSQVNQALMEIGATLCLPQNPHCNLCPLQSSCQARADQVQNQLPLTQEKAKIEDWYIHFFLLKKQGSIGFSKTHSLPVLKDQFSLPAKSHRILQDSEKTKAIFTHSITRYKLHVDFSTIDLNDTKVRESIQDQPIPWDEIVWVPKREVKKWCQSSMIQKVLKQASL